MTSSDTHHLEAIRRSELGLFIDGLAQSDHVLEIGGGSGFQSSIISEHVARCVAVDVYRHPEPRYPVTLYDGTTLPFEDDSFDVIFSSNVLEHVQDLEGLLDECARVLKPRGVMFHILPSATWRIWTTLTFYPALPKVLRGNLRNLMSARTPTPDEAPAVPDNDAAAHEPAPQQPRPSAVQTVLRSFKLKWIRSMLISPRHGERGNELSEVFYFRAAWWRALFERTGWDVVGERPSGLCYSGNILFGTMLGLGTRRRLSGLFGSSTRLFKVVRSGD